MRAPSATTARADAVRLQPRETDPSAWWAN